MVEGKDGLARKLDISEEKSLEKGIEWSCSTAAEISCVVDPSKVSRNKFAN